MKILIPFTPHLASECLQKIGERKIDEWPVVDKKSIQEVKIKVAIQINGKTKGVIEVKKDLPEKDLINIIAAFILADTSRKITTPIN